MRWFLVGLFLVGPATTFLGTTAWAASQTFVTLEYEVDPDVNGCPGAAEFRSTVERQLGYDPFRSAADRRVAVQIGRKGDELRRSDQGGAMTADDGWAIAAWLRGAKVAPISRQVWPSRWPCRYSSSRRLRRPRRSRSRRCSPPVAPPAPAPVSDQPAISLQSPATEQGRRAANAGTAPDGTSAAAEAVPRRWSLAGSAVGTSSHGTRPDLRQRTGLLDLGRDRLGRRAASNPKRGRRQRLFARPVRSRRRRVWSRVGLRRLLHDDGRSVAGSWARGGCSRLFVRPLLPAGGPGWRGGKSRSAATSSPPEPTRSSCSRRGR